MQAQKRIPSIVTELRRHARERPTQTALVVRDERWTYGALDRETDAYARGLAARGVRASDRVVLALSPTLESYAALIGVWKLGAAPAWVDPGLGPRALSRFIEQVSPRVAIGPSWLHALRTVTRTPLGSVELGITAGRRWFWGGPTLAGCRDPGDGLLVQPCSRAGDEWLIVPNSDADRPPVIWCYGQIASRARVMRACLAIEGVRVVHADPLLALLELCLGRTVIVAPHSPATGRFVRAIQDYAAEVAVTTVSGWESVADLCSNGRFGLPSLQAAVAVGVGVGPLLYHRLQRVVSPTCRVVAAYGVAEAFPVASLDVGDAVAESWPQTVRGAGWCVGRPASGAFVRITSPSDTAIPHWTPQLDLAAGDIGEIVVDDVVASPSYAATDSNRATKITFGARTLHRTGWLGYLDLRGQLWVCGAMNSRMKLGDGGWISPEAVEAMFDEHPHVARTALVGPGDDGLVVLCVQMKGPHRFGATTDRSLRDMARGSPVDGHLAAILPIEELPLDSTNSTPAARRGLWTWVERQRQRGLA